MCMSPIWWTKLAMFIWFELRTPSTPSIGSHWSKYASSMLFAYLLCAQKYLPSGILYSSLPYKYSWLLNIVLIYRFVGSSEGWWDCDMCRGLSVWIWASRLLKGWRLRTWSCHRTSRIGARYIPRVCPCRQWCCPSIYCKFLQTLNVSIRDYTHRNNSIITVVLVVI